MRTSHSFSVRDPSELTTDTETLLTYARAVIDQFHSCLYCGKEMGSPEAARAHMRSKAHERIQWESEEWSEFLIGEGDGERSEGEKPERDDENEVEGDVKGSMAAGVRGVKGDEVVLPSGARILSRLGNASRMRTTRASRVLRTSSAPRVHSDAPSGSPQTPDTSSDVQLRPTSPPTETSQRPSRTLAKRDQQGLVGLPTQQLRALAVTEHKALKRENRARMQAQWVLEKIANRQKHFKPDVPGRLNG